MYINQGTHLGFIEAQAFNRALSRRITTRSKVPAQTDRERMQIRKAD